MIERLTLARLKEILRARGFTIELKPDGSTSLRGRREEATPALMRAIAYWRDELIAELRRERAVSKGSITAPKAPLA